jgi:hypothetical protein
MARRIARWGLAAVVGGLALVLLGQAYAWMGGS